MTDPADGPTNGLAARRAALHALTRMEVEDAWSTAVVPEAVADLADPRDRAFASRLAYDTIRWEGTLDHLLEQFLTRRMADVEPRLRRILRMGVLQLWKLRVPDRAAVDTAVDLAREATVGRRADRAAGFVNGVLRNVSRANLDAKLPDESDPVRHLSLVTAHPEWIVRELLDRLPVARVSSILHADNDAPGVTLRAVHDRDAVLARLEGVDVVPTPEAALGISAAGSDPRELDVVTDGSAVVQDESSMLVVEAARVAPGDRIIDLCAAPGGKTTDLAARAGTTVVAVELHDHRGDLIREAAARTGTDVEVVIGDARTVDVGAPADVVLVDAPCTGLGVGRRRPEVRWRRRAHDPLGLASLQTELLLRAADLVAPGGRLVYAVCTWTRMETEEVASRIDTDARFTTLDRRQLWPDSDGTDGMFFAVWLRSDPPDV